MLSRVGAGLLRILHSIRGFRVEVMNRAILDDAKLCPVSLITRSVVGLLATPS